MPSPTATKKFPEKAPKGVSGDLPDPADFTVRADDIVGLQALPDLGAILDTKPIAPQEKPRKHRSPKAEARAAREETARVMFSRAVVALDACIKRLNEKNQRGEVLTRDENRALNQALYAVRNIVQWR
jgi:hypothetical protein